MTRYISLDIAAGRILNRGIIGIIYVTLLPINIFTFEPRIYTCFITCHTKSYKGDHLRLIYFVFTVPQIIHRMMPTVKIFMCISVRVIRITKVVVNVSENISMIIYKTTSPLYFSFRLFKRFILFVDIYIFQ